MATIDVNVQHVSIISSQSFENVMGRLDAALGHPNMIEFSRELAASRTFSDMEKVIRPSVGKYELMVFMRLDIGLVLAKSGGPQTPRSVRLILGNPLIMQAMARHVPDAGAYAPVTLLIDERPDGVHLSYDTMASLLAPYGNADALEVARDLDSKVMRLLDEAAG
jgi:hypothetical protein